MNFRTVADLSALISGNLHRIPHDVDVVVGIPRSGLLAANLIALALNRPLADLDGFVAGRLLATGRTRRTAGHEIAAWDCRRVLVVDDSIRTGATIREARARLATLPVAQTFCAVYSTRAARDAVDLCFEICELPRLFEWNFMHHCHLAQSCVDLDGVLCADPTDEENDDGDRYADFLASAAPLYLPTRPIGAIVTSRLERYRPQTEDWLNRHGVRFSRLFMMDLPDAATRRRLGSHARFKAAVYRNQPEATLFIESNPVQAAEIVRLAGKPVLDATRRRLLEPARWSPVAASQSIVRLQWRMKRKLGTLRRRLAAPIQ
jgi:uncharacterized HAD superfamily protein